MKLTLRLLLAYMDDILRPADARDVGKALAENKAAAELTERIRAVIRMRRLTAPDPLSTAPEQNANDTAEYLDNLMSPEVIRRFEQQCLESDEQLAEVGACHQILTQVLGGGLAVPESTQRKLQQLAAAIPLHDVATANGQTTGPATTGLRTGELRNAVAAAPAFDPDQIPPLDLKRSSSSWKQKLAVLGVLLLSGAWFYSIATDPSLRYDGEGLVQSTRPQSTQALITESAEEAAETEAGTTGPQETPVASVEPKAAAETAAPEKPAAGPASPSATVRIDPLPTELPAIDMADNTPANPPPLNIAGGSVIASGVESVAAVDPAAAPAETASTPMVPLLDAPEMPAETSPVATPAPALIASLPKQEPICLEPGITYTSTETPLLLTPEQESAAVLVSSMTPIPAGTTLTTPRFSLASFQMGGENANWQMRELTSLQVLGSDEETCLGFRMEQGQIILNFPAPLANVPNLRIRLMVHETSWILELPAQATTLAIDVESQFANHFEQPPAEGSARITLWVQGAPVKVQTAADVWQDVTHQQTLLPAANAAATPENGLVDAPPLPVWVSAPAVSMTTSQRRDYRDFIKSLENSTNLWLDLQGTANHPNARIAQLAAETLALGQQYESLIAVLVYSPHEESRTAAIAGLRAGLVRNPAARGQFQEWLQKPFNAETAGVVYQLLWGFNEADARNPATSRQLVSWLRHEQVAVRELSIYWIAELTGQRQGYRPLAPVGTREQGVASWERHLSRLGALLEPENQ